MQLGSMFNVHRKTSRLLVSLKNLEFDLRKVWKSKGSVFKSEKPRNSQIFASARYDI